MKWYNYVACFFAGAFLTNFIPHFIQGISGAPFPTPFSDPPGTGLSASYVNVLWAFLNLGIGVLLLRVGKVHLSRPVTIVLFCLSVFIMSIMLSQGFKHLYE